MSLLPHDISVLCSELQSECVSCPPEGEAELRLRLARGAAFSQPGLMQAKKPEPCRHCFLSLTFCVKWP